tara:strand:+ start:1306 stop:1725 length:420 start_codon:yes stop_codon:yes gene_type:complete
MNTEQFDGHTPGPWTYNNQEGREIWKCLFNGECFTDPSTYDRPGYEEVPIATMAPLPPEDDPLAEAAFERMMADKMLMAAAPDLLAALIEEREECEAQRAYARALHAQLVKATEWAYQQFCYDKSKMEHFDNHVWGEQE